MKGAFLVALDDGLFEAARKTLVSLGARLSDDSSIVQLRDEVGGLITIYQVPSELEWEYKSGPFFPAPGVDIPNIESMNGLAIECRNEDQFSLIVKAIADARNVDMWVVDGDGVVWRARQVDPRRVRL